MERGGKEKNREEDRSEIRNAPSRGQEGDGREGVADSKDGVGARKVGGETPPLQRCRPKNRRETPPLRADCGIVGVARAAGLYQYPAVKLRRTL